MCFCAMKMLGTVRWLEISFRASWMASPSSGVQSVYRTGWIMRNEEDSVHCGPRGGERRRDKCFPWTADASGHTPHTREERRTKNERSKLTNLIQLESCELRPELVQQLLRSVAVGTVRLGEDDNAILADDGLSLSLGGGGHGGRGTGEGAEEALEDERNGGRVWGCENRSGVKRLYGVGKVGYCCRVRVTKGLTIRRLMR